MTLLLVMETPPEMVTSTSGEEEEDNPIPRSSNLGVLMIVQQRDWLGNIDVTTRMNTDQAALDLEMRHA